MRNPTAPTQARRRARPVARRRAGGDRGATAVLFAVSVTALVTMSALGVDLGRAYAERRYDQNAADAAVMSGAVVAVTGGGDIRQVTAEIVGKVEQNLRRDLATAAWSGCADPSRLHWTAATLGLSPATSCISFSRAFDEIRVKVPDQLVEGTFGPALGLPTLRTRAAATGAIEPGGAGAPPFIALSTAAKGDFICLRTGGANASQPLPLMDGNGPGIPARAGLRADPCDETQYPVGSSTFGTLLPHAYDDGCQQREIEKEEAVSIGIDHILGVFPGAGYSPGMPERLDGAANCRQAFPNTLDVDTGFSAGGLRCALISLRNGPDQSDCHDQTPRLWQGRNVQSTYQVVGEKMDNTPIWTYLRPSAELSAEGAPASCVALAANRDDTTTWEYYDKFDALLGCLDAWPATTGPELFTDKVQESPRFAFIPQVHEATLTNGRVHIEGFLPIFLTRLYVSASNKPMCDAPRDPRLSNWLVHDAGQRVSCGGANDNIDRVASVVLHCGMVPELLCSKRTGFGETGGIDVYDFRLIG